MPGMSPPMSLKGDPDTQLKKVLKKHKLEDVFDEISDAAQNGLADPGGLKKLYIANRCMDDKGNSTVSFDMIDLRDPTTWTGMSDEDAKNVPRDDVFLDISQAIKADERRNSKRASYEF